MASMKFAEGRYKPYTLVDCLLEIRAHYGRSAYAPKPHLVADGWVIRFTRRRNGEA